MSDLGISFKIWAGIWHSKNSYNILKYLNCKVKKPWWRNMRNIQYFLSTKEQNHQNKFTLSLLRTWNNGHNDKFHNSQTDWLANCSAGIVQLANCFIRNLQACIFKSLTCMELSCFPESFRNFYVVALVFQN